MTDDPIQTILERFISNVEATQNLSLQNSIAEIWSSRHSFQRHLEKRIKMGHVDDVTDLAKNIIAVLTNVQMMTIAIGNQATLIGLATPDWTIILEQDGAIKTAYQNEADAPSFADNHKRLGYVVYEQTITPRMRETLKRLFRTRRLLDT